MYAIKNAGLNFKNQDDFSSRDMKYKHYVITKNIKIKQLEFFQYGRTIVKIL